MARIPESILDEIQARVDIAEIIGRYVPLKRSGRHYKARCPFHEERTPSFIVNSEKQIFHCFGCGAGGNVFSFLVQHDRLTFPEAARHLAEIAGVRIPEAHAESAQERDAHGKLLRVLESACRFYERQLADAERGKKAREYIALRAAGMAESGGRGEAQRGIGAGSRSRRFGD